MNIPLVDYFTNERLQHSAALKAVREKREQIESSLAEISCRRRSLVAQRSQRQRLLESAHDEERSVVQKRIDALDAEIAQMDGDVDTLQAELNGLAEPAFDAERRDLLASVLRQVFSCETAEAVQSVDECWSRLPLRLGNVDETGGITSCWVTLDYNEERSVQIVSARPIFKKGHRPSDLSWLPEAALLEKEDAPSRLTNSLPRITAFIDHGHRLILSRNRLQWNVQEKKPAVGYGVREQIEVRKCEDDFSDLADGLLAKCDSLFGASPTVDLSIEYDHPLMQRIREFVNTTTTATPMFEPTSELLGSETISAAINEPWIGFIRAPWSKAVEGNLALLKYHLENGEKPRFWSERFKDSYGFRLRTRDHSWLVGSIFVSRSAPKAETVPQLRVHQHGQRGIANIGPMWLLVEQQR